MSLLEYQLEWLLEDFYSHTFPDEGLEEELFGCIVVKDSMGNEKQTPETVERIHNFVESGLFKSMKDINERIEKVSAKGDKEESRAFQIAKKFESSMKVRHEIVRSIYRIELEEVVVSDKPNDVFRGLYQSTKPLHQLYYFYFTFDIENDFYYEGAVLPLSKGLEDIMTLGVLDGVQRIEKEVVQLPF